MKNLKLVLSFIVSLIIMLSLTTCKKYPEDGKLSWQTVKRRMLKHSWLLKECEIFGVEHIDTNVMIIGTRSCDLVKDTMVFNFKDLILKFHKYEFDGHVHTKVDGANFEFTNFIRSHFCFHDFGGGGLIDLISNKNTIQFLNPIFSYPFKEGYFYAFEEVSAKNWNILKLTNKELILKSENIKLKFYIQN